jgi:hypothetical protein
MNRFLAQALSAIGILVFAIGFPIAPLLSVSLTYGWGQTSISWVVALLIMAAWLWLGTRFVIRPRDPRYIVRIVASMIVFVAFLFVHPWIFGLSGRVGELRLEHSLRPGMTIAQATSTDRRQSACRIAENPNCTICGFLHVLCRGRIKLYFDIWRKSKLEIVGFERMVRRLLAHAS